MRKLKSSHLRPMLACRQRVWIFPCFQSVHIHTLSTHFFSH